MSQRHKFTFCLRTSKELVCYLWQRRYVNYTCASFPTSNLFCEEAWKCR